MPFAEFLLNEVYEVYRYRTSTTTDDIGAMPSPEKKNLKLMGETKGRVNTGDSLEPDVLGPVKDYDTDVTSMYIGFFKIPTTFTIMVGDIVIEKTNNKRKFQIQYLDDMPGGAINNHIECRLQTTDVWSRNG